MSSQFHKQKVIEIKDHNVDWSKWLVGNDSVASSTWAIPADLTVVLEDLTNNIATVVVTGGTAGQKYPLQNIVMTAKGLEPVEILTLTITD